MTGAEEEARHRQPPGANFDRLWTPWRAEYVGVAQPIGCFLCAIYGDDPANDRANLVLYRASLVYVLLNRFPYNPGHLLIASAAHVGSFPALDAAVRDALFALTQRATAAVDQEYRAGGFNIGLNQGTVAGAGVPDHLHVHVVPRWAGDANFATVIGETRVLPETLAQTLDRLRPYFAEP